MYIAIFFKMYELCVQNMCRIFIKEIIQLNIKSETCFQAAEGIILIMNQGFPLFRTYSTSKKDRPRS